MVAINKNAWEQTLDRSKQTIQEQGHLPFSPCHFDPELDQLSLCAATIIISEYLKYYKRHIDHDNFIHRIKESQSSQTILDEAQHNGLPVDVIHNIISLNNALSPKSRLPGLIEYINLLTYTP